MNERHNRIGMIMALAFFIGILIVAKLLYVQVFNNEKFSNASLNNRLQEIALTPDRGMIYDVKGDTLAISVKKDSVFVSPNIVRGLQDKDKVIDTMSAILGVSKRDVEKAVNKENSDFEWIARFVDKTKGDRLKAENFAGVGFVTETKREYPRGRLASQVVGFTGIDSQGLNGVELQFDNLLSGNVGKLTAERDGKGNIIPQSIRESIPATPGENVYLTIDSTVQYIVERELNKAMKEWKPLQVTCIVQEVDTGAILAMASLPDYDPNKFEESDENSWRNLAISKVYEPGSVFKTVSTSMYLDDGAATPESQYFCPGAIDIDGQELRCWSYPKGQGAQTLKQGFANSCNIVQAKSVARLGKDRFYDYLHGFGFTRKTGIELPGESAPVVVPKDKAVPLDLAAMSIGQANAYTPIQMISAISAVANGGNLMKPQIVSKETTRKNKVIRETKPELVRRVISEHSAAQMRDMMEFVVTDGIGKAAAVPGYRVGGKTGTAEIVRDGKYEKGEYNLSFGGFAPVNDPKVACIVIVNSPETNASSGTVVGPIFSAIIEDIMRYYEVPKSLPGKNIEEPQEQNMVAVPELSLPMNAEEARLQFQAAGLNVTFATEGDTLRSYLPAAGTKIAVGDTVTAYASYQGSESVTVPDFTGKTIKEVDRVLSGLGLLKNLDGSGLAWYQTPAAGTAVPEGSKVVVRFASNEERKNIAALQKEEEEKRIKAAQEAADKAAQVTEDTGTVNGAE